MNNFLQIAGPVFLFAIVLKRSHKINKLEKRVKENDDIIMFDNEVIAKRMEQIGDLQEDVRKITKIADKRLYWMGRKNEQLNDKDLTISDLTHDICVANTELVELKENYNFSRDIAISRWEEIRYLRRKIKTIRANRLKKVIKAEKLGGVR